MVRNDFLQRYKNANEVLEDLLNPADRQGRSSSQQKSVTLNKPAVATDRKGTKKLLMFAVLPLSLVLLFLAPRIWHTLQARKYYIEGNSLVEAGKYDAAITSFDKALSNRPDFALAWTNKGFAQGKLGQHVEKYSSCEQATDAAPDFAEAWNCRGLARFDLKQYEQALEEYNRAIAIDPEFYRGWYNKGQVLLKLGLPREAIESTRKVQQIKPKYFLAWTQLCQALYDLEQYQDAKAHCDESMNINPNYPPTITLLQKVTEQLK